MDSTIHAGQISHGASSVGTLVGRLRSGDTRTDSGPDGLRSIAQIVIYADDMRQVLRLGVVGDSDQIDNGSRIKATSKGGKGTSELLHMLNHQGLSGSSSGSRSAPLAVLPEQNAVGWNQSEQESSSDSSDNDGIDSEAEGLSVPSKENSQRQRSKPGVLPFTLERMYANGVNASSFDSSLRSRVGASVK